MPKLPSLKSVPNVMEGLHLFSRPILKRLGFKPEVRRRGDLKLGLWRKTWRKTTSGKRPRRLVIIPGFGDTPLSWINVVLILQPVLKKSYDEVILLDYPGYNGFLSKDKAFHSMDRLMEAIFDVLDSLQPHTILGHSLGGWLVGYYAGTFGLEKMPEHLFLTKRSHTYTGPERLILANPSGVLLNEERIARWRSVFDAAKTEGASAYRAHIFGKEPFWFKYMAHSFLSFFNKTEIQQFMDSIAERHLVNELLPHIQAETWLLWGERDSIVPSEWARDWLQGLNEKSRAVIIKDIGHSPQIEAPASTLTILTQIFLGKPLQSRSYPRLKMNWEVWTK